MTAVRARARASTRGVRERAVWRAHALFHTEEFPCLVRAARASASETLRCSRGRQLSCGS